MNLLRKQLEIQHSERFPTPNQWIHRDSPAKKQAMLLPGRHYSCDFPLFYFSIKALLNQDYDYLRIDYQYHKENWSETQALIQQDVRMGILLLEKEAVSAPNLFIGKSLGTYGLANIVSETLNPDNSRFVWLTPLLNNDWIYEQMLATNSPSLLVIGTKDQHYRKTKLEALSQKANWQIEVVDQADHSLEIAGQTQASFLAFSQATQVINQFIEAS